MLLSFLIIGISACKKDKTIDNPPSPPVEVRAITITDLRTLSTSASVKVPDGRKIKGIVISDASAKNVDSKTVILQEATDKPGIIITFDTAQNFAVGDEVEVNISNQALAQVDGEIIVQNVPAANVKKTGTGTIAAKQTTIADINTNKATWNSTLVTINVTELFSADGKYKGNLTIKDASGTLSSTVTAGAAFENTALPLSVTKLTGIVRINGTNAKLDIRNTNDITSGDITRVDELISLEKMQIEQTLRALKCAPVLTDVSFCDPQKMYFYSLVRNTVPEIAGNNNLGGIAAIGKSYDQTAKYVTVTFAGSTLKGKVTKADFGTTDNLWGDLDLPEFNPATDKIKIAVSAPIVLPTGELKYILGESPEYTETGKFFTLKVKLPTREELTAMGVVPIRINQYFSNLRFNIHNFSTTRLTNDRGAIAPVIISKVEVAY